MWLNLSVNISASFKTNYGELSSSFIKIDSKTADMRYAGKFNENEI